MSHAIQVNHQRFERYSMSLFSSRFYKYLTKYIKLVAQKEQLARILEILGKFRIVMLIYNVKF